MFTSGFTNWNWNSENQDRYAIIFYSFFWVKCSLSSLELVKLPFLCTEVGKLKLRKTDSKFVEYLKCRLKSKLFRQFTNSDLVNAQRIFMCTSLPWEAHIFLYWSICNIDDVGLKLDGRFEFEGETHRLIVEFSIEASIKNFRFFLFRVIIKIKK